VGVRGGVRLLETHYVEVFFTKVVKKIVVATVGENTIDVERRHT